VMYERIGAAVNRVTDPELEKYVEIPGVDFITFIPTDRHHAVNDIQGRSVFELPQDSAVYKGAEEILRSFDLVP